MTESFVVYIDESGDEGFQFDKGSPLWFVLSAVITEKSTDLETVKLIDAVRATLQRSDSDHDPLHFRKLKHEQRLPLLKQISSADLKSIVVVVHKPSINSPERFQQQRNQLYFYASRLLLERVSWYCRNRKTPHVLGDGSAEIIFSNRGGMKYDEFRNYMERLKANTEAGQDIQVDWSVIRPNQITALAAKRMGLQIADAVASSFFFGVSMNQYGFNEDRYVRMLAPIMYHRAGTYSGYGIKFWPSECEPILKSESHLMWLQDVYSF